MATPSRGIVTGSFLREGGPLGPNGQQPPVLALAGTVRFSYGHRHWIDVRVGSSGRFSVSLPPRTYTVLARTPSIEEQLASGALRDTWCSQVFAVTVKPDRVLRVSVVCGVP